jgi:uncharacterized protein
MRQLVHGGWIMQIKQTGWTVRRIVLTVLSVIVGLFISAALLASWNEPQVAGKLSLYQTNIILQGSTLAADQNLPPALYDALIGKEVLDLAKTQFQEARTSARDTADELQKRLPGNTGLNLATPESDAFQKANHSLQEINLDLGLIQAVQKQPIAAQQLWQQIERDIPGSSIATTAAVLNQLWTAEQPVPATAESTITKNLQGWFRYQSLKQLYTRQSATAKLQALESQQIGAATGSVYRLATIGIIRGGCVILGIGLGLWWGITQLWQQRKEANSQHTEGLVLLRTDIMGQVINDRPPLPSVPWNWETIWQVMLGFFVIGQLLIPQFFSIVIRASGWDRQQASLLENAAFILVSYGVLAITVIAFLRLSIAAYQPIDHQWFSFQGKNWLQWGIGGYLTATPIVLLVSVINDKIWQGKGGSNPLLSLLLENNDSWALIIFILTAAVAAPLFEEYLFRGFLFPSLTRYFSLWQSIGLSGLIFAIAHLSVSEVLPLAVLGSILAYIYYRTGNLLASMLVHSLWNGGSLLTLYLLAG